MTLEPFLDEVMQRIRAMGSPGPLESRDGEEGRTAFAVQKLVDLKMIKARVHRRSAHKESYADIWFISDILPAGKQYLGMK